MTNQIHWPSEFKTPSQGKLISFEGTEGAGKSTMIEAASNWLKSQGYTVKLWREPGSTTLGEGIRKLLLNSSQPLDPMTEVHLFLAARGELLKNEVMPFLNGPKTIAILDRYIDSTLAYQGSGRHIPYQTILDFHRHPPLNILPHFTFYLKIDLKTSESRQVARGGEKDYFEKAQKDFHERVLKGYEEITNSDSKRCIVIDATKDLETVKIDLLTKLAKKMSP